MRLSTICSKLQGFLPQVTNEFSTTQNATLSIAVGQCTVTATAHGLSAGDTFTLSGFVTLEAINYIHTVQTVPSANTFTFSIVQEFITATNISGTLHKDIRIHPAASVQLAVDSFAKQGNGDYKKVLYLIDLGETTSKDRNVGSDASFEMMRSTDFKMTMVNRFGILAILPLKNDPVGAIASEFSRDLLAHLVHTIVGTQIATDWENSTSSAIIPISSNRETSNNSFIVQNYIFEISEYVCYKDVNRYDFGYNINDFNLRVIPKIGE